MGSAHAFFICRMTGLIPRFKRKLTNLSSANPWLFMRRLKTDYFLDLSTLEYHTQFPAWEVINGILSGKKSIPLCSVVNPGDGAETQISLKINALLRKQRLTIQERGTNELQLAFPFVLGRWPDGSWVKTPLLLMPATLEKKAKYWQLLVNQEEIQFHPAFLLAYAFHFQQNLEERFFEKSLQIEAEDGLQFLTILYNQLKESGLDIHFNQELLASRIQPFQIFDKNQPPLGFQPGMLKLQPEAVLGLFPQSDSIIIPDFQFLEQHGIELQEIFEKIVPAISPKVKEADILPVLPMDGSQEVGLKAILEGKSIVVKGPPGTGKSQLIVNVLANAMATGKSVLLVCQKKVALEVVQRRLHEVGLGDHVGFWADYRNDKSQIFRQLEKLISDLEAVRQDDQHLDTVVLERQFQLLCRQMDGIVEKLEAWKSALFNQELAGISIYELYQQCHPDELLLLNEAEFTQFKVSEWMDFLEFFRKNVETMFLIYGKQSPLHFKIPWDNSISHALILSEWEMYLIEYQRIKQDFSGRLQIEDIPRLDIFFSLQTAFQSFQQAKELWDGLRFSAFLEADPAMYRSGQLVQKLDQFFTEISAIQGQWEEWLPEANFSEAEILQTLSLLDNLPIKTNKPWLIQLISLIHPGFRALKKRAMSLNDKQIDFQWFRGQLLLASRFFSVKKLFPGILKDEISQSLAEQLFQMEDQWNSNGKAAVKKMVSALAEIEMVFPPFTQIHQVLETGKWMERKQTQWQLMTAQWQANFRVSLDFESEAGVIPSQIQFVRNYSSQFSILDRELLAVPKHWTSFLFSIVQELEALPCDSLMFLEKLKRQWARAWVEKLEKMHPVLAEVGNKTWVQDLEILRKGITEKEMLSQKIVRLKVRERMYKDLEYNRLGNRTSYRELFHQVSKKRQRLTLRQIVQRFDQEICRLVPAWLATPESVSATWEMKPSFDLVIFDEASQCFAERGIPAAYRGKQLVVVGDEMQLTPHHLFSARWEEEGEEDWLSSQESLLDLGRQFLPIYWLRYHYRSQFPELMFFSNRRFYDENLIVIPNRESFSHRKPAIHYIITDGVWQHQRNDGEAAWIAEFLFEKVKEGTTDDFGVITFNVIQQENIERQIERIFAKNEISVPESLFVKNIENVQGDERDHIIFSIGYGPNESGKVSAQFGSLALPGGENRLNVAISRARKSISIIASIMPEALPVSENSAVGPRLLKAYLQFGLQLHQQGEKNQFLPAHWSGSMFEGMENSGHVKFVDGNRLQWKENMKSYFGNNVLTLNKKGFKVGFFYQRDIWQNKDVEL